MRFLMRGLLGLAFIAIMLSSVGYGIYRLSEAMQDEETALRGPATERRYSVNVGRLEVVSVQPVTTAYGQIESWRTLQIRASSDGLLVDVAQKFRDGAAVKSGDLLVRIDPADAEFGLLDAEAALADAEAQKSESEEAVIGAEQELVAARRQLDLRRQALERQKQLLEKGYSTMVQVEQEELSVAALEQASSNRLQSVITARKRIERMDLTVARAKIAVQNAERTLAETAISAPFDGYLDQVDATLGRRVSPSETLAVLIDPTALDVRFALSTRQFARFLDDDGALIPATVTVELELGERVLEVVGRLDRAAAVVAQGEAGRTLFANLNVDSGTVLRPGDFVTVRIDEPELHNVAVIPAAAASEDGRLLVVSEESRLVEVASRVLRRMADELVVTDVPIGSDYVQERLPHLGSGLKVQPKRIDGALPSGAIDPSQTLSVNKTPGNAKAPETTGEMVELEPSRRAALIEILEESSIPARRKARLRALLNEPIVPLEVVELIERRQGRSG